MKNDKSKTLENKKKTVVIGLTLLAVILAYVAIFTPFTPRYNPEGFPVERNEFLTAVVDAPTVYVVMDIRQAPSDIQRNIMQCGVDFAGSPGLANKEITTLALEEDRCIRLDGIDTTGNCLNELKDKTVFYIQQSDQTAFYPNAVVVGIREEYHLEDCRVNIV